MQSLYVCQYSFVHPRCLASLLWIMSSFFNHEKLLGNVERKLGNKKWMENKNQVWPRIRLISNKLELVLSNTKNHVLFAWAFYPTDHKKTVFFNISDFHVLFKKHSEIFQKNWLSDFSNHIAFLCYFSKI